MTETDGKRKVLISIVNHQSDGGNQERTETVYPGKAYEKDGCLFVFYEEIDEDNGKVTRASMRIRRCQVDIRKRGEINTQMIFIPGEVTQTEYRTPYGAMLLNVDTSLVNVAPENWGLQVELGYRLNFGGSMTMMNRMKIEIRDCMT